jgi:hypothetical protein
VKCGAAGTLLYITGVAHASRALDSVSVAIRYAATRQQPRGFDAATPMGAVYR